VEETLKKLAGELEAAGIYNAEGVNFSVPRKSEMASLLKQRMVNKQIFYLPLLHWERHTGAKSAPNSTWNATA